MLTDRNLSHHLTILEEAGYVGMTRGTKDSGLVPGPRSRSRKHGCRSFAVEMGALKAITDRIEQPGHEVGQQGEAAARS